MEQNNLQQDEIAFKDFKGSVSKSEFETILTMAREEYDKCKIISDAKKKFEENSAEKINEVKEQSEGMPPGLAKKLIEGFHRAAQKETMKVMGKEVKRSNSLVDFLNRFQDTSEMLPYLEFNFLKEEE
tara:strand:+ start:4299 stop:4682 length:384 start_codon:yes stop_codon:yes gene_type:complete